MLVDGLVEEFGVVVVFVGVCFVFVMKFGVVVCGWVVFGVLFVDF